MSKVLILGAGTAGTMLANKLVKALPPTASITVVDKDDDHDYQPGYLFIPFGTITPERVRRSRKAQLSPKVELVTDAIVSVDPKARTVELKTRTLSYDWLVIATGTTPRPDMTEGLTDERIWRKSAFDFYTRDGAIALKKAMESFKGGKLLIHITEMPIKCPVAPLEFAFLADDFFRHKKIRHLVDITYVTPLDGAFTKPVASKKLGVRARGPQHPSRHGLRDRTRRPGDQEARGLRRPRDPVRPPGDRADEHGRAVRDRLGDGRRPRLRAGGQEDPPVDHVRERVRRR